MTGRVIYSCTFLKCQNLMTAEGRRNRQNDKELLRWSVLRSPWHLRADSNTSHRFPQSSLFSYSPPHQNNTRFPFPAPSTSHRRITSVRIAVPPAAILCGNPLGSVHYADLVCPRRLRRTAAGNSRSGMIGIDLTAAFQDLCIIRADVTGIGLLRPVSIPVISWNVPLREHGP